MCLALLASGTTAQEQEKKKPDLFGKITKVEGTGETLTLTVSTKKKGDAEATMSTVKTNKDTKIEKGAGKDKAPTAAASTDLAEGKGIMVWLAEGKKTTAARIVILGGGKKKD
jgi:hypothetical protein